MSRNKKIYSHSEKDIFTAMGMTREEFNNIKDKYWKRAEGIYMTRNNPNGTSLFIEKAIDFLELEHTHENMVKVLLFDILGSFSYSKVVKAAINESLVKGEVTP